MASSSAIPTNKGISVKNEPDDPEINAMALKMKESYKKNAIGAAEKQASSLANAPMKTNNTQNNYQEKLPTVCEDIESIKGRFSWKLIEGYEVPYIKRVIKGEHLKFVSVRMAEAKLLSNYLHYLNSDIYTCTSVRSHFITDSEAKLLNTINQEHANCLYGRKMFFARKDCIVRLEDVIEFRTFIKLCYTNLQRNNRPAGNEKCGFIRIGSDFVVPYCIKDSQKYVPLFFFEGNTENMEPRGLKFENWDLAYLKFCCKVQGIRDELFASNSCTMINLDEIRSCYPPETNFEEYWPSMATDTQLLTNQSTHVNPSGVWIIAPSEELVSTGNNIPQTSTAPSPAVEPHVDMNNYQNGRTGNQALQTMSQGTSLINSEGYVVPPSNPVLVYYTAPYSNVVPISQCVPNMSNPMTNNNLVMSHSSQMPQLNAQHTSMISQTYLQQLQQQQIQQIITTPQTQQSYYSHQPVHGRLNNTQQHNALRNVRSISTAPVTDIIDLSSSPPSSVSPTEQASRREFSRILEQPQRHDTSNNAAYKIQKVQMVHGKIVHCINAKPHIYSDWLVILDDLVKTMLPFTTVASCGHALNRYLNTTISCGNSEQLAVLRENGHLSSVYQNGTPLASLHDVMRVFEQLKTLLHENTQKYQSWADPSKRRRYS